MLRKVVRRLCFVFLAVLVLFCAHTALSAQTIQFKVYFPEPNWGEAPNSTYLQLFTGCSWYKENADGTFTSVASTQSQSVGSDSKGTYVLFSSDDVQTSLVNGATYKVVFDYLRNPNSGVSKEYYISQCFNSSYTMNDYLADPKNNTFRTDYYTDFDKATTITYNTADSSTVSYDGIMWFRGSGISGTLNKKVGASWTPVYMNGSGVGAYLEDGTFVGWCEMQSPDGSGKFIIRALPTGKIYIKGQTPGYISEYYVADNSENAYTTFNATAITLSEEEVATNKNIYFDQTGTYIKGTLSGSGVDTTGARVVAFVKESGDDTFRYFSETTSNATTSTYMLYPLPVGLDYKVVAFEGEDERWYQEGVSVSPLFMDSATTISLGVTGTTNIDIIWKELFIISGYVYDAVSGNVLPGATVQAFQGDYLWRGTTTANASGYYELGVLEGEYKFLGSYGFYQPVFHDGKLTIGDCVSINVTDNVFEDIYLIPGGGIFGIVTPRPSEANIAVFSAVTGEFITDTNSQDKDDNELTGYFSEDGRYFLSGVPIDEPVHIRLQSQELPQVYYDMAVLTPNAELVTVDKNEITSDIDFNFTGENFSNLTVDVLNEGGYGIGVATLNVYRVEDEKYITTVTTNASGRAVIPLFYGGEFGNYYVQAFYDGYVTEFYSGSGNAYSFNTATSIALDADGETRSIKLAGGFALSGHLDIDGNPAPEDTRVLVFHMPGFDGNVHYTTTDENGNYQVLLPRGRKYKVMGFDDSMKRFYDADSPYGAIMGDLGSTINLTEATENINIDYRSFIISGEVVDAEDTDIKLGGALVQVFVGDYKLISYTTANAQGVYSVEVPVEGEYKVRGSYGVYRPTFHDDTFVIEDSTSLNISANYPDTNLRLVPGARIYGSVMPPDSVSNVNIAVFDTEGNWLIDSRSLDADGDPATGYDTDTGLFSIPGVPYGEGIVVRLESDGYPFIYYDATIVRDDAIVSTLNKGQDKEVIFNLSSIEFSTLTVNVTDDGGAPLSGVTVNVFVLDGDLRFVSNTTTNATGKVSIPLMYGSYVVQAFKDGYVSEFYDNSYSVDSVATVPIDSNGNEIDMALATGYEISGTLLWKGDLAPEGTRVLAFEMPGFNGNVFYTESKADGTYSVYVPAGDYKIMAFDDDHKRFYLDTSVYGTLIGDQSSTKNVLGDIGDIDIHYKDALVFKGYVYNELGDGVPATVNVFSGYYDLAGYAKADSNGYYEVGVLDSGDYQSSSIFYQLTFYDGVIAIEESNSINITSVNSPYDQDITLIPGGKIAGRVIRPGGTTATIEVFSPDFKEFYGKVELSSAEIDYQVIGVPVNTELMVRAKYDDSPYMYYKQKLTPQGVSLFEVGKNNTKWNVDFDFTGYELGTLQVTVVGPAVATVNVYYSDPYPSVIASVTTNTGVVTIPLFKGAYAVEAAAQGYVDEFYNDIYKVEEADDVVITEGDVTPITISLDIAETVKGTLINYATDEPVSGVLVQPILSDHTYGDAVKTSADGTFEVEGRFDPVVKLKVDVEGIVETYYIEDTGDPNLTSEIASDNFLVVIVLTRRLFSKNK
ncbi:carboxypeptidase regulatory-like domain-containing protein [Candidatus Margulisiibacteriota bacterium]